ncbi:MAG: glycosyltransferase family 2 protein, partial [Fusobacterium sp.]
MKDKVLISVIITVYNGEKYIKKAIESILNQTLKEIEIIIVDNKSNDKTLEIIKNL